MLTKEEKDKIVLEEKFRAEVAHKLNTKSATDVIETIIKMVQGMAIIAGIIFTYKTYRQQVSDSREKTRQDSLQTTKDYKKTFYENQYKYYSEATDAAATLATENIGSADYIDARKKFWRLYWGKLSMVENKAVEHKMVEFGNYLTLYERKDPKVTQDTLQQVALKLARTAGSHNINAWLDTEERKDYPGEQ